MKVKLKPGWSRTYPELTIGNVYRVLGIEGDDLRIINDAGEPVLYHPRALSSELVVSEISRAEFEEIWDKALDSDVP